jgi:hypothetical protein
MVAATKLDAPSLYTRLGTTGACQPFSPPQGTVYYATGDQVPPSAFVDATETTEQGDGLVERYRLASDGAREHVGWALGKLGVDCTFQVMKDGATRCVPIQDGNGTELYTDPSCQESSLVQLPYYGGPYPGCPGGAQPAVPKAWVRRDVTAGTCEPASDVAEIGDKYVGTIYQKYMSGPSATTCSLRPGSSTPTVYRLGSPIALPGMTRVSGGPARLVPALVAQVDAQATTGVSRDLVRGWHDNERDADCTFATASDGKIRCLPVSSPATIFFGDASCQGPARFAGFGGPTCGSDRRYARESSGTCTTTTRVWSLGDTQNIDLGSASTGGHCAQVPLKNVYAATEVDPAQFVEATLTTD